MFEAYVVVDWSANSRPKMGKDSIWIAEAVRLGRRVRVEAAINLPTRAAAYEHLAGTLLRHRAAGRRVMAGFDFAFGYPRGFAAALGLTGGAAPWWQTWCALAQMVKDEPDNANNRWTVAAELNRQVGRAPGPFWCCPTSAARPELCVGKGRFPHGAHDGRLLAEYRLVDERMRAKRKMVQSVWKLFTTGSVGSQTLLGIPWLHRLRSDRRLARFSRVWPFETGFVPSTASRAEPSVVHVELWPSFVPAAGDPDVVRDARQVATVARHLAERDADGTLAVLCRPPDGVRGADLAAVTSEEGWILGA